MGAEIIVPLAIAAASSGAQIYNTRRTEGRQDRALAASIQNQARKQQQIDQRTSQEVAQLEQSRSADEAASARQSYGDQLRRNVAAMGVGTTPGIGSAAFQGDAVQRTQGVQDYAGATADLLSRIDAPGMQRQGEGFGFQRLATDNALSGREAAGQAYLDELRLRSIRRNPWIDAASQIGMAYAGGSLGKAVAPTATTVGNTATANSIANAGPTSSAALARGGMFNGYYVPPRWG